MENSHRFISLFLVFFSCFLSFSHGNDFYVGGKQGWVLHPSEDYNQWAGRNRFLINDNLIFKYKKGADSVLLVNKDDCNSCNAKNPIQKMDNGNSVFKFEHSGPFYFISGEDDKCKQGQKLIVVVLHIKPGAVAPKLPPGPVAKPPAGPKPTTPAPGVSPVSHSPVAKPPSTFSPGPSVSPGSFPAPGMSPVAKPPSTSSSAPAGSPSSFPVGKPPSTSSSPPSGSPGTSPSSSAPAMPPGSLSQPPLAQTPEAASPPASTSVPATSPSGSTVQGSPPAGSQSPPGEATGTPVSPNSSASVVHSSMMALAVSIMLSLMVRI